MVNALNVTMLADSAGIIGLAGASLEGEYFRQVPLKIDPEAVTGLLSEISGTALKLFFALGSKLGSENSIVEISTAELETITHLSKQTVREGLNELQSLGIITRLGPNVRRKYRLNEIYLKRGK
ncbi:hypothetical protein [Nostoc sp.]